MPAQITMTDVAVLTSKLSSNSLGETEEYALFEFNAVDEVIIDRVTINYSYDMANCNSMGIVTNDDIPGTTANSFECTNPVMFIINNGQVC